jgi:hypothetical protein
VLFWHTSAGLKSRSEFSPAKVPSNDQKRWCSALMRCSGCVTSPETPESDPTRQKSPDRTSGFNALGTRQRACALADCRQLTHKVKFYLAQLTFFAQVRQIHDACELEKIKGRENRHRWCKHPGIELRAAQKAPSNGDPCSSSPRSPKRCDPTTIHAPISDAAA